ncbi:MULTISPECIES: ATP-binding protein [unclassified Streptomyces]|uniref:ATP-binding protein n=1 Tax=unclassified Streptomyces TaxID=2593676 RepID=UPI0013C08553|nr:MULTISPECIES: ATP-binding protein [unclassified Streptomyces]MCZ4118682.1 ATP-binding protein [Streptomyces sp. H39-S7]NEA59277.1 ATP-binding protein [Streptomyces sp. SID13666]NEA74220.1 ATP-binding protein [Streptomyces sp. SID13588]
MHHSAAHPGPHASPPSPAACGYYLLPRPGGFVLHMATSPEHLRRMRAQVFQSVTATCHDEQVASDAQLVASELVGNAAALCGPWAPVVVTVRRSEHNVHVRVHDPLDDRAPARTGALPDNAQAESGRGLWIVDALAPGWTVQRTPLGKQISCTLPCPAA